MGYWVDERRGGGLTELKDAIDEAVAAGVDAERPDGGPNDPKQDTYIYICVYIHVIYMVYVASYPEGPVRLPILN